MFEIDLCQRGDIREGHRRRSLRSGRRWGLRQITRTVRASGARRWCWCWLLRKHRARRRKYNEHQVKERPTKTQPEHVDRFSGSRGALAGIEREARTSFFCNRRSEQAAHTGRARARRFPEIISLIFLELIQCPRPLSIPVRSV